MKIKLDENLHVALADAFLPDDYDVETVADEGLVGADDDTLCRTASAEDRLIITLDRGFGDLRKYPPGTHAGIVVLRRDDHSLPAAKAAGPQATRGRRRPRRPSGLCRGVPRRRTPSSTPANP